MTKKVTSPWPTDYETKFDDYPELSLDHVSQY